MPTHRPWTCALKFPASWIALAVCAGCASVKTLNVTSDPPGADIWMARPASSANWTYSSHRTPHTYQNKYHMGLPWMDHAFQVRKPGYYYSAVLYESAALKSSRDPNRLDFHFILRPLEPAAEGPLPATPAAPAHRASASVAALPPLSWPKENIAVADLTTYALSQDEANTLTERLHSTVVETKYFNVLSRPDMKAVLEAQQFQRTGPCDDSACLVEMGKVLAVQKVVGGSIGKVGTTFSLSLRLINVETGQIEFTADRKLKAEPDDLLDLVQEAGRELALKYGEAYTAE